VDPSQCESYESPSPSSTRQWIVGHRGALYQELENTLPGFQYCVDLSIDAVELDVFRAVDNTLVVFHGGEAFPGDMTSYCDDQSGISIQSKSWEEIQNLRFSVNQPEYACDRKKIATARIPSLRQVLNVFRGTSVEVKIELKGPNTVELVLDLVDELEMASQCTFSSFHHVWLEQIKSLRPHSFSSYRTGVLWGDEIPDDFIQKSLEIGASEVHLKYDTCTVQRVRAIHDAGMKSMAWFRGPVGMHEDVSLKYCDVGNEDEAMYLTVLKTGVQQLCCNRPNVLQQILAQSCSLL
jgi:glycerophosphoryl diester phosphodiesterase